MIIGMERRSSLSPMRQSQANPTLQRKTTKTESAMPDQPRLCRSSRIVQTNWPMHRMP